MDSDLLEEQMLGNAMSDASIHGTHFATPDPLICREQSTCRETCVETKRMLGATIAGIIVSNTLWKMACQHVDR